VHNFVCGQSLKGVQDLTEVLYDSLLREPALFFDPSKHISSIAVLKHQIVIMRGLLQGSEFDYMGIVARLQYLDLVLE
jgi:hypothetical protein